MKKTAYGESEQETAENDPVLRNQRLEARYDFDKGPESDLSTVAWVSSNQAELAKEFWEWRRGFAHIPEWPDALRLWEGTKFGNQLEPCAHALLRFACRQLIAKGPESRPDPKRPQLSEPERIKRLDEAVGKMAREKAFGLKLDTDRA